MRWDSKFHKGLPHGSFLILGILLVLFTLVQSRQKSESDLVFDEDDRNLLISDPKGQRHKLADPVDHEDGLKKNHRRSRQSWSWNWGDEEEETETESKGSNIIDNSLIDGGKTSSSSPSTTTTSSSTPRSTLSIERRSVPTDDEDILREASGEELEGSGDSISRGDVGPTTATTTTTTTTTTTSTSTTYAPATASFEKRFFRVRLTIQKTWSPALESSASSSFKVYQSDLEEAFRNSDLDIESLHVVRFVNINDPAFVQCIFDIGLMGYLRNQVDQELQIIMDVGKVGNIRVRRDGYEVRDIGAPAEPICSETQLPCRNGDCVPSYARCDGAVQCADSSDEEGCPPPVPPPPQQPVTTPAPVAPLPQPERPSEVPDYGDRPPWCRADDQVRCPDGFAIICKDQECDGVPDCPDGFDETNCTGTPACPSGQFFCDLTKCIPEQYRCDGLTQCEDGTDELSCPTGHLMTNCSGTGNEEWEFKCLSGSCIRAVARCDGKVDCSDASDEYQCQCLPFEWECDSGDCIPRVLLCDGSSDCLSDSSDEKYCTNHNCTRDQFRCRLGRCIPATGRCNTSYDCGDNDISDELKCPCDKSKEFRCHNDFCIPLEQKCDGTNNCQDGSDESYCTSRPICSPSEFQCDDGTCIPNAQRCNFRSECPDQTDEIGCPPRCRPDQYQCADGGQCLNIARRCDRVEDCPGGDDEIGCPGSGGIGECSGGEFRCSDGLCISRSMLCDGYRDCNDNGDEEQSLCQPEGGNYYCPATQFRCYDGSCLPNYYRCNGRFDCPSGEDELNCTACKPEEFRCENGGCIELSRLCDYIPDCEGGEDEANCSGICGMDDITCGDGSCVPVLLKCNGNADCSDGADEFDCNRTCRAGQFRCGDGTCVGDYLRCDGRRDCRDGSDERDCSTCAVNAFRCSDGHCIEGNQRCDRNRDCPDGSDEDSCSSGGRCSADQFQCANGDCIVAEYRCDNYVDCGDRSDEEGCTATTPPPVICSADQFRCQAGGCIPLSSVCNSRLDCADGSDEINCPVCRSDQFRCGNGVCISNARRCDRRPDCADSSDEQNCPITPPQVGCPSGQFTCRSRDQCVPSSAMCDGKVDCNDFSDEAECAGPPGGLNLRTYPADQTIKQASPGNEVVFQCRDEGPQRAPVRWSRGNGLALPPGSRSFNGRLEMPNIGVEHTGTYICEASNYPASTPGARVSVYLRVEAYEPPPTRPPTACGVNEATCANGQCIPKDRVCDGIDDCSDGSDEMRCRAGSSCEPNEFRCSNKRCVPKTWRCDGDDDCGDGTDEAGCTAPPPGSPCRYNEFQCATGNQCIPKAFHCDKEIDCQDRSDEYGCSPPVIQRPPLPLVTIDVGDVFNISCSALGIPTPEVVWRLNWGHIPEKCSTVSSNGAGVLTCPNIQIPDQGAYSCEAINSLGSTFAIPDCILVVKDRNDTPCGPGTFNDLATSSRDCLPCFCFGHSSECKSANLYVAELPPPEPNFRIVSVMQDLGSGQVAIQERRSGLAANILRSLPGGVQANSANTRIAGLSSDTIPYFALPPSYSGNLLRSYSGSLRYNLRYRGSGRYLSAPDVIISGNGLTLLRIGNEDWSANREHTIAVRYWDGEWYKRVSVRPDGTIQGEQPASREEIIMVLTNVENLLIRAQYDESTVLDTTVTGIRMDTAINQDTGKQAVHVEECRCPPGYTGLSCEECAPGFERERRGPWLGSCVRQAPTCPDGYYSEFGQCIVCPCPSANQRFGTTCFKDTDGRITCNCIEGHVGRSCDQCSPGYTQSSEYPYECRPGGGRVCDEAGSLSAAPDNRTGQCLCKDYATGPLCTECKPNTFHLCSRALYGCINCFCMGITSQCRSSSYYRTQEVVSFVNNAQGFTLVDESQRNVIREDFSINPESRELGFMEFSRYTPDIYYWQLPYNFLGDKVTSYGGYLNYTVRHIPPPGGQHSPNSAADVEINGNDVRLLYFRKIPVPPNSKVTVSVPLLEQYWQRQDGQMANREHLLMALANIDALLIKATYTTSTREAHISDIIMDYAVSRNTGQDRAYEVEHCQCPTGYIGLSCQECAAGYTRSTQGLYLGLCEACSCNGQSDECDPNTGVCRNCRGHTTGDFCEECEDGYEGNPRNGEPCRPVDGGSCRCDARGSTRPDCPDGRNCVCKGNVEGSGCNTCRSGTFALQEDNPQGCLQCYCSRLTTECASASLYRLPIEAQLTSGSHGFTLTNSIRTTTVSEITVDQATQELSYRYPTTGRSERLFWSLPPRFTGNRVASYGGKLRATRRYYVRPAGSRNDIDVGPSRAGEDIDVILIGNNGVSLFWIFYGPLLSGQEVGLEVSLKETAGWRHLEGSSNPASREDLLGVLSDVAAILIRASYTDDMEATFIKQVSLDDAVRQYTQNGLVMEVEECRCPAGYEGLSCESCTAGYYRDPNDRSRGIPGGSCRPCPCGENAESCRYESGRPVCVCRPGFSGPNCEVRDRVVVELYPVKVMSFVGNVEEFRCSYESRLPLRIQFATFPDWNWLVANLRSANIQTQIERLPSQPAPPGEQTSFRFGSNYTWDSVLVARIPILPQMNYVICRISNSDNETVAEVFSAIFPVTPTTPGPSTPRGPPIEVRISEPLIQVVQVGSSVTFRCNARSITGSQLRIRWNKEGNQLPPGRSRDDGLGLLVIDQALPSDSGTYICSATDGRTSTEQRAVLTVGGGPGPTTTVPRRPEVVITPTSLSVQQGDPVEFRCTARGYPSPSVTWTGGRAGALGPHVRVDNGILRISSAHKSDEAEYFCTASNVVGTASLRTILYVQGEEPPPPIPVPGEFVVTVTPPDYEARPGETVRFRCDASQSDARVSWTKLSGGLPQSATTSPDGILNLYSVREDDGGIYVCTGTSATSGKTQQSQARLSITYIGSPPTARIEPERQTVAQGAQMEIRCIASGQPSPTVQWSKVGGELPAGVAGNYEILRIPSVDVSDRGVYICTVTNGAGKSLASAVVEVDRREAPQIEMYPSARQTVSQDGSALFQCRVIAGIPSPKLSWSRANGLRLPANVEEIPGGVIRFNRVSGDERGQYICTAESIAGTTTAIATLEVQSPPKVTVTPGTPHRVRLGERVRLECRAEGDPLPSVSWKKLTSGRGADSVDSLGTPQVATYEIQSVTKGDEGSYSCIGRNDAGYDEGRIQLLVEEEPSPGSTQPYPGPQTQPPTRAPGGGEEIYQFPVGSRAILNCVQPYNVGLFDQLYFDWERSDGGPMPSDYDTRDGNLYINDVRIPDAGRYRCVGRNRSGQQVLTVNARLDVVGSSPPRIVLQPPRQIVRRGDVVNIDCIATGDQPITISWAKVDRRPFPPSVIVNGAQLTFRGIEVTDAGRYACTATNAGGMAESVAEVIVNPSGGPLVTQPRRREQTAYAGQFIELDCLSSGSGPARWRKDGGTLPIHALRLGNKLQFIALEVSDTGRYICETDEGSETIDLTVEAPSSSALYGPPTSTTSLSSNTMMRSRCEAGEFECSNARHCIPRSQKCDGEVDCLDASDEIGCPPETFSGSLRRLRARHVRGLETVGVKVTPNRDLYRVGEDVEVRCDVSGDGRRAAIEWTKVGGSLGPNVRTIGNLLRVNNVEPDNGGVYRCTVTTAGGKYEEDYALTIQANPDRIQNSAPIETKTAPYGSTVLMDCRTDLDGQVVYTWHKQAGLVSSAALIQGATLTIPDVNPEDAGTYICSASNAISHVDIPTVLVVTGVVPHFSQSPQSYMALPTLPDAYLKFDIEISFKPDDRNGLILYNGQQRDGGGDFISFGLSNGIPEFRFDVGSGPAVIRGDRPLPLGQWHTVKLSRDRTEGTMIINEEGPFFGSIKGNFQGLNLIEPLYVGGVSNFNSIHRLAGQTKGFQGCISQLIIGGKKQQLLRDAQTSRGVSTCDTCAQSSCRNGGICQEGLTNRGYSCICRPGYSGEDCETPGQACYPNACGLGKCVNVPGGFDCYCPFGKTGVRCERDVIIYEPSFSGESYLSYPTPKALKSLKMALKIKPETDADGLLMYSSQTDEGNGDYTALSIRDKHVEFQYDTGSGPAVIRSKRQIRPGEWLTISLERHLQDGELIIEGDEVSRGKSPGTTRGLNLKTPLYVGGYDRQRIQINSNVRVSKGFAGCVSELDVAGMDINLVESVLEGANVENCGGSAHECPGSNPCLNEAKCRSNSTHEYYCECPFGYSGRHCEIHDVCASRPCKNGGVCHAMGSTYKCACLMGFHGKDCQEKLEFSNSVAFRGEGYLELNRSLMPHSDSNKGEIITIQLSTTTGHGIILWHAQPPSEVDPDDYLAIALNEGRVEIRWELGSGEGRIESSERVDDGKKHKLVLRLQGAEGSLEIDDGVPDFATSPGLSQSLNTRGNIFIGGLPDPIRMTHGKYSDGFIGCVHSLKLQTIDLPYSHTAAAASGSTEAEAINLNENAVSAVNVGPCTTNGQRNGQRNGNHNRRINGHHLDEDDSDSGPRVH